MASREGATVEPSEQATAATKKSSVHRDPRIKSRTHTQSTSSPSPLRDEKGKRMSSTSTASSTSSSSSSSSPAMTTGTGTGTESTAMEAPPSTRSTLKSSSPIGTSSRRNVNVHFHSPPTKVLHVRAPPALQRLPTESIEELVSPMGSSPLPHNLRCTSSDLSEKSLSTVSVDQWYSSSSSDDSKSSLEAPHSTPIVGSPPRGDVGYVPSAAEVRRQRKKNRDDVIIPTTGSNRKDRKSRRAVLGNNSYLFSSTPSSAYSPTFPIPSDNNNNNNNNNSNSASEYPEKNFNFDASMRDGSEAELRSFIFASHDAMLSNSLHCAHEGIAKLNAPRRTPISEDSDSAYHSCREESGAISNDSLLIESDSRSSAKKSKSRCSPVPVDPTATTVTSHAPPTADSDPLHTQPEENGKSASPTLTHVTQLSAAHKVEEPFSLWVSLGHILEDIVWSLCRLLVFLATFGTKSLGPRKKRGEGKGDVEISSTTSNVSVNQRGEQVSIGRVQISGVTPVAEVDDGKPDSDADEGDDHDASNILNRTTSMGLAALSSKIPLISNISTSTGRNNLLRPLLSRIDTSRDFVSGYLSRNDDDRIMSPRAESEVDLRREAANALVQRRCLEVPKDDLEAPLRVHMATWNVNSQPPPDVHDITLRNLLLGETLSQHVSNTLEELKKSAEGKPLTADEEEAVMTVLDELPDLVVICLQEVEMGGVVLLKEYTETSVAWSEAMSDCLNSIVPRRVLYRRISMVQLVGLVIIVCCRADHIPYIRHLRSCVTRTGAIRGVLGNKGSVSVRLTAYGKRFLFVGAHFHAHKHNEKLRNNNYHMTVQDMRFDMPKYADDECDVLETFMQANTTDSFVRPGIKGMSAVDRLFRRRRQNQGFDRERRVLNDHDYIFFLGDLNSRLHRVKRDEIKSLVHEKQYNKLVCHDELRQGMVCGDIFDGFQEASIKFPPTYKFDPGTDTYDTSRKMRDPAWCDRILFRRLDKDTQYPSDIPYESCTTPFTSQVFHTTDAIPSLQKSDTLNGALEICASTPMVGPSCVGMNSKGDFRQPARRQPREATMSFFSACTQPASSKSQRAPPFITSRNNIEALAYDYVDNLRASDHRPVCGQFEVSVLAFPKDFLSDIIDNVTREFPEDTY